jgi:hypothetical protein
MLGYYLDTLFRVIGGHITQHIFPLLFVRAFQNPLTSEKVLREYSESLNPLKLFVSHSSASLNNKPMFLPFTYSNDNRNN